MANYNLGQFDKYSESYLRDLYQDDLRRLHKEKLDAQRDEWLRIMQEIDGNTTYVTAPKPAYIAPISSFPPAPPAPGSTINIREVRVMPKTNILCKPVSANLVTENGYTFPRDVIDSMSRRVRNVILPVYDSKPDFSLLQNATIDPISMPPEIGSTDPFASGGGGDDLMVSLEIDDTYAGREFTFAGYGHFDKSTKTVLDYNIVCFYPKEK